MRITIATVCLILLLSTVASAKIVFNSRRDGVLGLYVMADDGSTVTLLTDTLEPGAPRWSPDGKQIVFYRQVIRQDSQRLHLFLMNANGTNVRQLTVPHNGRDAHPSFSPGGKSILFTRYKDQKRSLCVLSLESGVITQISDFGANKPDWSPDGKQIVCSAIPGVLRGGGNLWIMNADGTNARELLPPPPKGKLIINRWDPRWSPDGKQILYRQTEQTIAQIDGVIRLIPQAYRYLICDRNGKNLRELKIPKNWYSVGIAWMDNGASVLITAIKVKLNQPLPDGAKRLYNIYKYDLRTGKRTRLTNHPGKDFALDWVSDAAHSVSSVGKMPTQWGELKTFEREQQ